MKGKGFLNVGEPKTGEVVFDSEGGSYAVENIRFEIVESPETVYNFQVEDYHTYHVGNIGVLVHNKDYGDGAGDVVEGGSGVRGKLTGSLDGLTADERTVVNELLDAGNDVEIIPRSNIPNNQTPDFYVNGVKTELKTLNGTSLNTPLTRIQNGFKQGAKTVIIDARKTGMTSEVAEKIMERALGIYNGELPGTVEIWTTGGIIRR